MLTATVSGSFHRHLGSIYESVCRLKDLGVCVLSPADPRVVDQINEFLFVASDRSRSVRLVEDRHLECIRASDFVWLEAPDGYVGQSASMEVGFAVAHQVPVFASWQGRSSERATFNHQGRAMTATISDLVRPEFGERDPMDLTLQQYIAWVPNLETAVRTVEQAERAERVVDGFRIDPLSTVQIAHDYLERIEHRLRRKAQNVDDLSTEEVYAYKERLSQLLSTPRPTTLVR